MLTKKRAYRGFTLLELLVALAIFTVIGVAAYRGLDNILLAQNRLEHSSQRLAEIQFAMQIIARDIEQMRARPVRDEYGGVQDALQADQQNTLLMSFTRHGWDNPLQQSRSQLQRVLYRLSDGALSRAYWPHLDGQTELRESVLLQGIESFTLRWLGGAQQWRERWPDSASDSLDSSNTLPRAVELTLNLRDWGEIRRLLLIPNGS